MEAVVFEDSNLPTPPHEPLQLAEHRDRIGQAVEAVRAPHEVERLVGERQARHLGEHEVDAFGKAGLGDAFARGLEVRDAPVGTDHLPSGPGAIGQPRQVRAVSARRVEDASAERDGQSFDDAAKWHRARTVKRGQGRRIRGQGGPGHGEEHTFARAFEEARARLGLQWSRRTPGRVRQRRSLSRPGPAGLVLDGELNARLNARK